MAQYRGKLTTDPGPRFEQSIRDALEILRKSADSWAKGDPEDPPTEEVLRQVLRVFERQRFLQRP